MKNQEKEIIHEAILSLKNLALENSLTSFSIISKDSTDEHYLDAIVCGKPVDIILSLILVMDQNYDVYKIVKTAVMGYEKSKNILSMPDNSITYSEELIKSFFNKIHNG